MIILTPLKGGKTNYVEWLEQLMRELGGDLSKDLSIDPNEIPTTGLETNEMKVYRMVWDRISPESKKLVQSRLEFQNISKNENPIQLLQVIRKTHQSRIPVRITTNHKPNLDAAPIIAACVNISDSSPNDRIDSSIVDSNDQVTNISNYEYYDEEEELDNHQNDVEWQPGGCSFEA